MKKASAMSKGGVHQMDTDNNPLDKFKGAVPYAAQYVGTYQPLVGWSSKTTQDWVDRQNGAVLEEIERKIKEASLEYAEPEYGPGPIADHEWLYDSKFKVFRDIIFYGRKDDVKVIVDLVTKAGFKEQAQQIMTFFNQKSQINQLDDSRQSFFRRMINLVGISNVSKNSQILRREKLRQNAIRKIVHTIENVGLTRQYIENAVSNHNEKNEQLMFWAGLSEKLMQHFILSPVGLVDLYRHYFFDFGTFLGPSVEHIWVAPGSETELIEISSRTDYRFRESETSLQMLQAEEKTVTEKSEFSEEIQKENENDINAGISAQGGMETPVYKASGSTSMEYKNHIATSKKSARKRSREISSKVTTETKRSIRMLTRESTEIKNESSRRHLIKNTSNELISYELRRKMQQIGVQVQHLGTQLCWQLYIDKPGGDLGLAELVHIAKPEDFDTTPPPDVAPPSFEKLTTNEQLSIPFEPIGDEYDDNGDYSNGRETDGDSRIKYKFTHSAATPQTGYILESVRESASVQGSDPSHDPPSLWAAVYTVTDRATGTFEIKVKDVNFEKNPAILVPVQLIWEVDPEVRKKAEDENKTKMNEYHQAKQREAQQALVDALRERIELARSVEPRPSEDLREEERTVLYRRVLSKLMSDVLSSKLHEASELIRTLFEVEKLLYFVAPDWWNPTMDYNRGGITQPYILDPEGNPDDSDYEKPLELKDYNRVRFGREHGNRPDKNYMITEDSEPAPLGSSIGWLLQLDGDSHRNAFLNSAWVQVVIPIRRGKEKEALAFLKQAEVEGNRGLGGKYIESNGQPKLKTPLTDDEGNPISLIDAESNPVIIKKDEDGVIIITDKDGNPITLFDEDHDSIIITTREDESLTLGYSDGSSIIITVEDNVVTISDEGDNPIVLKDSDDNPVQLTNEDVKVYKTVEEVLDELAEEIAEKNNDDALYLAAQTVYENGFDPLAEGFDINGDTLLDVFAQWVEILPTNQIVPVQYETD